MKQQEQVDKLKQMAIDLYNEDAGFMYECTSDAEYVALIKEHGTAKKAWAWHMCIINIKRDEQCAGEW